MKPRWLLCALAATLLVSPTRIARAEEPAAQRADVLASADDLASDDFAALALDLDFDMPGGDAPQGTGGGTGAGTPPVGQPGMEMLQRFMQGMGAGSLAGFARPTLREQLALTAEQEAKLADIRDRRERKAIPIQADIRLATLDMRKLMRADKPDPRAVNLVIDKLAGLRASLEKARVAATLEVRAVFTPAQQKVLREYRARHPLLSLGARLVREWMMR